jgi:hypothetical protein
MIKLRTPLVLSTVLVVTVLCVVRLVLMPDFWASSLAALAFFPIAIGVLFVRARSASKQSKATMIAGKTRAAFVGAGVLLAVSLLLSITDHMGLTGQSGSGAGGILIAMLSAIAAVALDLVSARLEQKAEKDPE